MKIIGTIIFILMVQINLAAQNFKLPSKWKTWIDTAINLSISYPPKWELLPKNESAIRFFLKSPLERKSELFRQNIFLHCKINNSESKTVDDFISEKTMSIYKQKFKLFKVVSKESIIIDNLNASHLEYIFEQPIDGLVHKIGVIERQVIFVNRIYKFTYTFLAQEDDNFREEVLKIFDFLKFGRDIKY